jgi:hypothetical protein
VKRDLEQLGFKILPSRMWNEGVFIQTKDEQLHSYVEWCGCNTLDFPAMEKILSLTTHISLGTEIAYKEADLPIIPPTPVATATGIKGKRMDPMKTVQRLQELGVISDQTKETLRLNHQLTSHTLLPPSPCLAHSMSCTLCCLPITH